MKTNKIKRLFLLSIFLVILFGLIACKEDASKNSADKPDTKKTNVVTNTEEKPDSKQVYSKEIHPKLSKDDIVNLVESIDPYELKPKMSEEERYNLKEELYQSLSDEEISKLSSTIIDLSLLLTGTIADNLYKNLINTNDPKWSALIKTNCYYAREKLDAIKHIVPNQQPLLDDINIVIELCEEGVAKKDVLKIVDAHRILFDISNHLFQVPFTVSGEEIINHGNIHEIYFKASKTLEGSHNLISN